MFDRNSPAYPIDDKVRGCTFKGLTKFEEAAMRFTAALLSDPSMKTEDAIKYGILAAEEFCRQMEEREK